MKDALIEIALTFTVLFLTYVIIAAIVLPVVGLMIYVANRF